MDMQEVNRLIETFAQHGLTSLELEEGNYKIAIKKEIYKAETASGREEVSHVCAGQETENSQDRIQEDTYAAAPSLTEAAPGVVRAQLVGMFYTSSSPEEAPFVKAGDRVKKGQVLGIIEAMKLMNEVTSEWDGVVKEVLAENGEVVEYGQPLFVLG